MSKFHQLFLSLFLFPFVRSEFDYMPGDKVKLIRNILTQRGVACTNIIYSKNQTTYEYLYLLYYHKRLASDFTLVMTVNFDKRLENSRRCSTTLNVIFGWHRGIKEELIKISYQERMASSLWLIFIPFEESTEEYLKDVNVPFNAEFFITAAQVLGERDIGLERSYRVADGYPLRVSNWGTWLHTSDTIKFNYESQDYIYAKRNNLEGFPIRASSKDDHPLSKLIRTEEGTLKIDGFLGLIYYELAEMLNFTPVYVPATRNVTGASTNGTWNGLMGMLQRKEIDLSIAPQVVNKKALPVASFLKPTFKTHFQIFYKQDGNLIDWFFVLKPFDVYTWLLTIFWLFISSVAMNKFYKAGMKIGSENPTYRDNFTTANSFFSVWATLCRQTTLVPDSLSLRTIFLSSFMLSIVLLTAYSAALISKIAVREPLRPFDSLETLLKDGSYKLIAVGDSTDYTYFSESNDSLRKNIFNKIMKPAEHESKLISSKEEGMDIICRREKYALFTTFDVPEITAQEYSNDVSRNCIILHLKSPLDIAFFSIPRRKNFPFSEIINNQLLHMELSGILKRLKNKAWPLERSKPKNDYTSVTIEHILFIYIILMIGIISSVFIFFFEYYSHKQRVKK